MWAVRLYISTLPAEQLDQRAKNKPRLTTSEVQCAVATDLPNVWLTEWFTHRLSSLLQKPIFGQGTWSTCTWNTALTRVCEPPQCRYKKPQNVQQAVTFLKQQQQKNNNIISLSIIHLIPFHETPKCSFHQGAHCQPTSGGRSMQAHYLSESIDPPGQIFFPPQVKAAQSSFYLS